MVSKRFAIYLIVFNVVMSLLLLLFSQLVLLELISTDEVVRSVGISIDTQYIGPIELTPTGVGAPLWNYPLFVLIFTLIGNTIFIVQLRRENKEELCPK
jgi:hypothetical protein